MSKTIKISDENIKFLNKFREHKRETWDDLFNKLREKVENGKKKSKSYKNSFYRVERRYKKR